MNTKRLIAASLLCVVMLVCSIFIFSPCVNQPRNRLSDAASPYLQEHADNPVNWYPWGEEALAKAKAENKPLLISIGYASCHWCHEMEKESFMDTAVARLMNDNFVCIKVDREERPDIDNIYAATCQLLTGSSGWPLHAFALPDGRAFFAGTYYAKPSWINLLKQISTAYTKQYNTVVLQAQALANGVNSQELSLLSDTTHAGFSKEIYLRIFDSIQPVLDFTNGGVKGTPKFPAPYLIEWLLQYHFLTNNQQALEAATASLTKMALGGIYDQVGGGFSRYAVDSAWHIPHFEKMLYDNAQLLSAYAHAYQLTGNPFYKTILQETTTFLERDLKSPGAAYYSSLNADTDEGEGVFYSWTAKEFAALTGPDRKNLADYYQVSENGNWDNNRNILFPVSTPEQFGGANNIDSAAFHAAMVAAKKNLLQERGKRAQPSVDKKILTAWNALAIKGLLDVYAALGDSAYLQTAINHAQFIETTMLKSDGRLWRNYAGGKASVDAFLEDYAYCSDAFIKLYQHTLDRHWLTLAHQLAKRAIEQFYDAKSTLLFRNASKVGNTAGQPLQLSDNSLPSPNAVMARVLYTLGVYYQNGHYLSMCQQMLSRLTHVLQKKDVLYYSSWSFLLGLHAFETNEVVVIGPEALVTTKALLSKYCPQAVFMGSAGDAYLPLMENKNKPGTTLIYVCTNQTCKIPVALPEQALVQLQPVFNQPVKNAGTIDKNN
jgi:uncharacterized protein